MPLEDSLLSFVFAIFVGSGLPHLLALARPPWAETHSLLQLLLDFVRDAHLSISIHLRWLDSFLVARISVLCLLSPLSVAIHWLAVDACKARSPPLDA